MEDILKNELIEIYSGEFWQASMIETLLLNNNIQAFLKNELIGSIQPSIVSAGGLAPVKVVISMADQVAALEIIEDFNNNQNDEPT